MDSTTTDSGARVNNLAHLRKGQEKMREMRQAGWKPIYKNPVERAAENPNSKQAAIKAFCWVCVGADSDPGAKFRVRDCSTGERCPLFKHRPWQDIKGGVQLNVDGALEVTKESDLSDD